MTWESSGKFQPVSVDCRISTGAVTHVLSVAAFVTAEPTAALPGCLRASDVRRLALREKSACSELLTSEASFHLLSAEKQVRGFSS